MEYILPEFIKEKKYTITDGVFECSWAPSKTIRINNSEYYNVDGVLIDPSRSEVRLLYRYNASIIVKTEFLAYEVKIEYDKKNRIIQIYT